MSNKFNFEEADAAIQEAEAMNKYEHGMQAYAKAAKEVENATQEMTACKNKLEDFSCKIEPIIKRMNDANTIKLLPEVKKEIHDIFNNACDNTVNRIEEAGRNVEKRIKEREYRKTVSEPLFYCMWWMIVMLSLFFGCVFYANYEYLHLKILWKMITYIGVLGVIGVVLIIYCYNKIFLSEFKD